MWDEGTEYTEVECSANGGGHSATISWSVEDRDCDGCTSGLAESMMGNQTQQDGSELAWSLLRLPTHMVAGRVVVCIVDHPALRAPERREIWVPLIPGRFPSSTYDEDWESKMKVVAYLEPQQYF